MRSETREQKVDTPPSYRIDNECNPEEMPQYFQISVGVLQGSNYTWLNPRSASSYVVVTLGNKKYRTTPRRNKQEPHYKEYFTFCLFASLYDLQRSSLILSVMEVRCCAPPHLLGEAIIDLGTVWRQPYFQPFRKWTQLALPRDPTAGSMGFLKVDISITCRGDLRMLPPIVRDNNIEVNYLMSCGLEQQPANFIITVHGAFGLPNPSRNQSEKHQNLKPPNSFIRVLFCGLQAKTAIQNRSHNPVYNEQVSIVEMFPSSNPVFRFEMCSTDSYANRLLASVMLNLDHISHAGENGFLPTFGPSLLPVFGFSCPGNLTSTGDNPFYKGSLLISLNTTVPYYQQSLRSVSVEPAPPISRENLWTLKNFRIFCPIFEVSMLDSRLVSERCGIAITIGDITNDSSSDQDFTYMMNEVKTRKLHYTGPLDILRTKSEFQYLDFSNTYPVLQLATQLPDYRYRMYRNNSIHRIVFGLKSSLSENERRYRDIDYTTPSELLDEINTSLDVAEKNIMLYINSCANDTYGNLKQEHETELDKKQLSLQLEEMKKVREKIIQKITLNMTDTTSEGCVVRGNDEATTRRAVKSLLSETHAFARELEKLLFKATEGWPDVVVWLLRDGSRVGFCKIQVADIIYSNVTDECGVDCGRIKSIYFKPLKCSRHVNSLSMGCFCAVGKVELLAWMGLHEQSSAFEPCLPKGYRLKIKDFEMCIKCNGIIVECRIFIYKARLYSNNSVDNLGQVYLRINTLTCAQDSKAIEKSTSPVWNQMIRFRKMMNTSSDRLLKYPPVVLVEVNSTNLLDKTELIGRFQMDSMVDDDDAFIPKLEWHEMYIGMENTGKVLMSVQIFQVPETFLKSTIYTQLQECFMATDMNECENSFSDTEQLPRDILPRTATYKLDIYWWGLRNVNITKKPYVVLEIEDIVIKSEVVVDKKDNCNFPNGIMSQTFEASFDEYFRPCISVKLYDSCTFGRTLYIGTSFVKKPSKFLTYWYPKVERDASLNQAAITSPDYVKVNQTLYVKKKSLIFNGDNECGNKSELSCSSENIRTKQSFWRRIFCSKEPDEEEYTLLRIPPENSTNKINKKHQKTEKKDWWSKYVNSLKNCNEEENVTGDQIVIYGSELELQPQFSKFKDWCVNMKFYKGDKTGISEEDNKLQYGLLKAGIAIYKWPPPENTVAVNADGVDLNQGFFSNYPRNESAKFLVRVYVIKGIDLVTKNISGKFYPFVIISCGTKQLGDRSSTVTNSVNPIFGTVYELRCTLPEDYQLTVSVYNHDMIGQDELIGNTVIDLENRIYTRHRACVGLASEYNLSNPGKWRDCVKPSIILQELCAKNHLPELSFPNFSSILFNGVEYKVNANAKRYASLHERRENVCLNILRNWNTLPICGYPLVPEHVETRTLYNPESPGEEQGKIHMWIDIFPIDPNTYIPPPVDITPRKTEEFNLKLTIYKVKLFKRDIKDRMEKASNLCARVWIGFVDQMQNTNCRLMSSDGYYVFNWCMIFNISYDYAECKLVRKERNQFTDYEENINPELKIQLLDSDSLFLDQPIGSLELNLNEMARGEEDPKPASDTTKRKKINLFTVNTISGWWTLSANIDNDDKAIVGSIKMDLTLLPKQGPTVMSVGLETDQLSSFQERDPRFSRNSSASYSDVKKTLYEHNALWCALIGVFITSLSIITFIYFLFTV